MKKTLIAAALTAATLTSGCASMVEPSAAQSRFCDGVSGMSQTECLNMIRQANAERVGAAFEKGFNRGMKRGLHPGRFGTIRSETTFRDGTTVRSKTNYRTGGFGGTKIETKYY